MSCSVVPYRRLAAAVSLVLAAEAAAQEGTPRRGPFATRPAIAGAVGVLLPTGEFGTSYGSGPLLKGALHLPLRGRVLLSTEVVYARLPVQTEPMADGLPPMDARLAGGAAQLILPVGSSRLPVPGLGGGAPYLVAGGGLMQFARERRTESFRPSVTGGVGVSFDAPGHHEAFVEARVMTVLLVGQRAVTVPVSFGFRW